MTSGDYGGDTAFQGAGAGGDPTAVAVVSDLMFVAENLAGGPRPQRELKLESPALSCDFETPWYLRFWVKDQPGIIASLAAILSAHRLNIDAVLQKPGFDKSTLPFVITLEPAVTPSFSPRSRRCQRCLSLCGRACACRFCVEKLARRRSIISRTDYSTLPVPARCLNLLPLPSRPRSSRLGSGRVARALHRRKTA